MRTRLSNAVHEQLLALREAQTQLARHVLHTSGRNLSNEPARQAILEAARVAADHARRLDPLLARWNRGADVADAAPTSGTLENTTRDLVESWIAVAEDARDLYEHAAEQAPPAAATELRRLASEKTQVADRLRTLL